MADSFIGKGHQTLLPNSSELVSNTIAPGTELVSVGTVVNAATDFIVMPSLADVADGFEITICCNAGGAFEIRTPSASGEKINTVDSDGSAEYLATDTETIKIRKVSDTDGWSATGLSLAGAVVTAVVPD